MINSTKIAYYGNVPVSGTVGWTLSPVKPSDTWSSAQAAMLVAGMPHFFQHFESGQRFRSRIVGFPKSSSRHPILLIQSIGYSSGIAQRI
jgi:hypothetical protein